MARYIDADKLKPIIEEYYQWADMRDDFEMMYAYKKCIDAIDEQPTVEERS